MVNRVRARTLPWLIGVIAAVGLATAGLGSWLAWVSNDEWYDALWLEVAKAGVQVVAVGVLGGALAAAWHSITAERERRLVSEAKEADERRADAAKEAERRTERNAKIRGELADLIVLYNDVKAIRRTLRSLGLDVKLYVDVERREGLTKEQAEAEAQTQREQFKKAISLTEEQARGFHEQMRILNTLQLGYESKVRQFAQADLLGEKDTATVRKQLEDIESYLNHVLALWTKHGWAIREGTRLDVVSDGLSALYRQAQFKPGIKQPMRKITRLINKHLFGAPAKTHREPAAEAAVGSPGQ